MIDVSFGIPGYMQEYWERHDHDDFTHIGLSSGMRYNFAKTNPYLESSILQLHDDVGNAEVEGYRVVIGNGASQIVSAVAYAAQKINLNEILLEAPYWGRLQFLLNSGVHSAGFMGPAVKSHKALITSPWFKFAVSPNNPDGRLQEPEGSLPHFLSVVDMCYYWPQYVDKVEKKAHDVMIFGLSKATGHAGTRLGWALVKDQNFASLMREYIEESTCGVSNDAQERARTILWHSHRTNHAPFQFAKTELAERWEAFAQAAKQSGKVNVLNANGMFAWCEYTGGGESAADEMLKVYGLKVMPGTYFGSSPSKFRVNLGCDKEIFNKMLGALRGS
jgi:L-tryptophan--pyruvate aminotransferase